MKADPEPTQRSYPLGCTIGIFLFFWPPALFAALGLIGHGLTGVYGYLTGAGLMILLAPLFILPTLAILAWLPALVAATLGLLVRHRLAPSLFLPAAALGGCLGLALTDRSGQLQLYAAAMLASLFCGLIDWLLFRRARRRSVPPPRDAETPYPPGSAP